MQQAAESRKREYFRSAPSSAFDQYLHDIQKLPLITDPAEERRLARLAQKGDEAAAERLVTANLRFVISYVKKYQGHGLDLSELVAIGNEGLLKAVRKFDPDQGVKFISYAVWWVRQAVLKALAEQTRSVRIPLNQNSQLIKLGRAEQILQQVLRRDPTDAELGRLVEDTPENVRVARHADVADDRVVRHRVIAAQELLESAGAVGRLVDLPPAPGEEAAQRAADGILVVDEEDAARGGARAAVGLHVRASQVTVQKPARACPSGDSRSFSKARSRICRMRSRVTPMRAPMRSSVIASEPSSSP
jgi:RNA polymerase sigma factor (sigma-70 family)